MAIVWQLTPWRAGDVKLAYTNPYLRAKAETAEAAVSGLVFMRVPEELRSPLSSQDTSALDSGVAHPSTVRVHNKANRDPGVAQSCRSEVRNAKARSKLLLR